MKTNRIKKFNDGKNTHLLFKGIIAISLLLLIFNNQSTAQFYTGGSVSVNYDKGYYVDVAPLLGYKVGIMDFGISPFYSYSHRENQDPKYSYGNRFFTQLTFYKDIFAHAEMQMENVQIKQTDNRKWIVSFPVGAGVRYPIAPSTMAYGMVLYDLLLDEDSPSKNPIIRAGVITNF